MTTQHEDDRSDPPPRYRALVGLLLLVGLVVAVLFVVHELQEVPRDAGLRGVRPHQLRADRHTSHRALRSTTGGEHVQVSVQTSR